MQRMSCDPFGKAVLDFYETSDQDINIDVKCSITEDDVLPVPYLFRKYREMPTIEQMALDRSRGEILDIGAGAGCHSLHLQQSGHNVTAIDLSPGACEVMRKQGLKNVVVGDIFKYSEKRFDTLLMLMNGAGVCAKIHKLGDLLEHLKTILKPEGQILVDSSDLIYMYTEEDGSISMDLNASYYGEVVYRMSYKDCLGDEFDWVFIDPSTLAQVAEQHGFQVDLLFEDDHYAYLMKLTLSK